MKRILPAILILVFGCDQISEQAQKISEIAGEPEGINILETAELSRSDENCSGENCTEISVSYPVFEGALSLNNRINSEAVSIVQAFVQAQKPPSNLDDLCEMFISDFQDFKSSFGESTTAWFLSISAEVEYNRPYLVSIALVNESYTGGAHANSDLKYLNLNQQGKLLKVADLVDLNQIKPIAEEIFRNAKGISRAGDLSEAGYSFNENAFHLPENIGFGAKGILLYYNNYEIASHATGPTAITIPYAQVTDALKFKP